MPIEVECPHCSKRQFIAHRLLGEDVDCEGCKRVFTPERLDSEDDSAEDLNPIARLREQRRRRSRMKAVALTAILLIATVLVVVVVTRKKRGAEPEVAQATRQREREQPDHPPFTPNQPFKAKAKTDAEDPPPPFVPIPMPKSKDDELRPAPVPMPRPGPAPMPLEPSEPFVSDRPAKEVFAGYFQRASEGFKLYVSRMAYEKSDEAEGEPLKLVDEELKRVAAVFPPDTVKALRKFAVWIEWDHTIPRSVRAFAVYYGTGGEGLLSEGVDPRKSDTITILSLKTAVAIKAKGGRQNTLLHEFAHIVHAKVFADNTFINNAFQQAQARGLYDNVKHDNGGSGPAYASRNQYEYFAELTCAYFDTLDYTPHDRMDLKDFDSVGYEMMTKAWGTPEQIEQRKKEAEKSALKLKKK